MFPLNLARILANQTDHEKNTDHVTKLMSLAEIVNLTMIHFEQFKNQHYFSSDHNFHTSRMM